MTRHLSKLEGEITAEDMMQKYDEECSEYEEDFSYSLEKDHHPLDILTYTIDPHSGCWNWSGRTFCGYGVVPQEHRGDEYFAHRLSFSIYKEEIPDGMNVCHKCDNRRCVNPEHLFLGTAKDNIHDSMDKGRWMSEKRVAWLHRRRENLVEVPR